MNFMFGWFLSLFEDDKVLCSTLGPSHHHDYSNPKYRKIFDTSPKDEFRVWGWGGAVNDFDG